VPATPGDGLCQRNSSSTNAQGVYRSSTTRYSAPTERTYKWRPRCGNTRAPWHRKRRLPARQTPYRDEIGRLPR
jgi:hypothetical protein